MSDRYEDLRSHEHLSPDLLNSELVRFMHHHGGLRPHKLGKTLQERSKVGSVDDAIQQPAWFQRRFGVGTPSQLPSLGPTTGYGSEVPSPEMPAVGGPAQMSGRQQWTSQPEMATAAPEWSAAGRGAGLPDLNLDDMPENDLSTMPEPTPNAEAAGMADPRTNDLEMERARALSV